MFKVFDRVIEVLGNDPDRDADNIDHFIDGDTAIGTITAVLPNRMYKVEWDWIASFFGTSYKQREDGEVHEDVLFSLEEAKKLAASRGYPVDEHTRGTLR